MKNYSRAKIEAKLSIIQWSLKKLSKNVIILLQKSNKRFYKGTKSFPYDQFPSKLHFVKHQQKVNFIFESKISSILRR